MRGHGSFTSPPLPFVRVGGGGRRCASSQRSGRTAAAPAGDPAAVAKVTNLNKKALDGLRPAGLRHRARPPEAGAGGLPQRGPRAAPDHRAHAHPLRRRRHRRVQAARGRHQAVPEGAGDRARHQADQVAGDARAAGRLRGGGAGGRQRAEPPRPAAATIRGKRGGEATAAGGDDNGGNAAAGGDEGDDDHPKPKAKPRKKKSDDDDKDKDDEGAGQKGTIFLGLTIGSSAGIASGSGHMNPAHQLSAPGFAVGQLGQIEPQIGLLRELDDPALASSAGCST